MTARCFIALELDDKTIEAALAAQRLLDSETARRVPREALHLTLKFLGHVSVEDVARPVLAALAPLAAATPPPLLGGGRLDGFPSLGRAHVVVLSCADPELRIAGLAARAEEAAASVGVQREARPFTPHVTLARSKDLDLRKLSTRLAAVTLGQATHLTLFESAGSTYTPLASAAFAQPCT